MHLQNTNRTEKTKTEMDKLHITKKSNFVIIRLPTALALIHSSTRKDVAAVVNLYQNKDLLLSENKILQNINFLGSKDGIKMMSQT